MTMPGVQLAIQPIDCGGEQRFYLRGNYNVAGVATVGGVKTPCRVFLRTQEGWAVSYVRTTQGVGAYNFKSLCPGNYYLQIEDDNQRLIRPKVELTTIWGAPRLTDDILPFQQGVASTQVVRVSLGKPPFVFTSATLPTGVSLFSGGVLTYDGAGADANTIVDFTVTDDNAASDTKNITVKISLSSVTASYWKITFTAMPVGNDGYCEIKRVRFLLSGTAYDVSLATVTATSNYEQRLPSNLAKNGDATSAGDTWTSSTGALVPHSVFFNLGAPKPVDQISMGGADAIDTLRRFPTVCDVYSSTDGTTYTLVKSITGMTSPAGAYQFYSII